MKITILENQINSHPEQFLRQTAGYAHIRSHHTGKESYVRRLTRDHYPRLHMYISRRGGNVIFDLHLDQKKTSYQGSHAHNAEYDGPVVEGEIERLKGLLLYSNAEDNNSNKEKVETNFQKIGHGSYDKNVQIPEKKSLWRKLFGL